MALGDPSGGVLYLRGLRGLKGWSQGRIHLEGRYKKETQIKILAHDQKKDMTNEANHT